MTRPFATFAAAVRGVMDKREWGCHEVAKVIGVCESTVRRILRGHEPSPRMTAFLCLVFPEAKLVECLCFDESQKPGSAERIAAVKQIATILEARKRDPGMYQGEWI